MVKSSKLFVILIVLLFSVLWFEGYWDFLFNPDLQNDDVRTCIFPFHRYGPEKSLKNDPISNEMLVFITPAVHLLYRIFVPLFGIYSSTKLVQLLCIGVILFAGFILIRNKKIGLNIGLLFLFLIFHTTLIFQRGIAGGLPRSFAFPLFALWTTGAFIKERRLRFFSIFGSALFYPSSMLILLISESFFLILTQKTKKLREMSKQIITIFILFVITGAITIPILISTNDAGKVYSLKEAQQEPAFGREGRLGVLPFKNPVKEFIKFFSEPLLPSGKPIVSSLSNFWPYENKVILLIPLSIYIVMLIILALKIKLFPWVTISFLASSTFLYILARFFAFLLYSPERFYSFGMPMGAIIFIVEFFILFKYKLTNNVIKREIVINNSVSIFILINILIFGNGIDKNNNGMTIDRREHIKLYEFVKQLDKDIRISCHPYDGDDIPFWTGRATMGGFETLQPWFKKAWEKQKKRTFDTIDAMYATDINEILFYAQKYHVSHFLINKDRYKSDFKEKALMFQPFGNYILLKLGDIELNNLVFFDVKKELVKFEDENYLILEVKDLEKLVHANFKSSNN